MPPMDTNPSCSTFGAGSNAMSIRRGPLPDEKDCQDCPLAVDGKPARPVKGIGPENPKFIVIGEGPGVNEAREGLPFIGKSGQILAKGLASSGLKKSDIWITNTTLCLPPREAKESAVEKARGHCYKRLLKEIDDLGPDPPILAVGKHAAQSFLGDKFKITELAGTLHTISLPDIPFTKDIIPTIHPAAMIRGGDGGGAHASDLLFWFLQYDIAKILALYEGKVKLFSDDIDIEASNPLRAHELIANILEDGKTQGWLACDLETMGRTNCNECPACGGEHSALEVTKAQITSIGFATEQRAVSVNWRMLLPSTKELIRSAFADKKLGWVFHNRVYDDPVLECNGFPIAGPIDCTQYMHHNAFPGLPHKLQRVGSQFLLLGPWKAEFRHGEGSLHELLTYNARDTLVTARLKSVLWKLVQKRGAEKTYAMDMRKCAMAKWMQIRGVPISKERNTIFREYFTPQVDAARKKLLARLDEGEFKETFKQLITIEQAKVVRKADVSEFGLRQQKRLSELEKKWAKLEKQGEDLFNLNSPPQIVAYLKACGVNLTSVTKKGKLSTKKDVLEQLIGHPAVRELLAFRANEKLLNTFITPYPYLVDKDWRIHPVWSPNKITGRFGSSPNMQNLTKGKTKAKNWETWYKLFLHWKQGGTFPLEIDGAVYDEVGIPNLRWQILAPKGRKFVGADFKQLEARIIALLSNDAWLCNLFNTDGDIHSYFAAEIFPEFIKMAKKSKEWTQLRDLTKRAEYGYFYGALVVTVWKALMKEGTNVSISTITRAFKIFEQKMPGVIRFYVNLLREVAETGKVSSFLLERSEYFPLGEIDPTAVKNFVCQAGGADIADTGIVAVHEALKLRGDKAWLLVHGHDSGAVECDEAEANAISEVIRKAMTQEYTLNGVTMKFSVDVDIGDSLGDV